MITYYDESTHYLFVLSFTAQSTQWGHVERGQFTKPNVTGQA